MKNILLILLSLCLITSCKKREDVSKVVNVSFPTITLMGASVTATDPDYYFEYHIEEEQIGFVSVMPGEISSLSPTGTDALLNEAVAVNNEQGQGFNSNEPGLYINDFSAKNSNGYHTLARFYVAVTPIPDTFDLSGIYARIEGTDTIATDIRIDRVARGLYKHTDITGDGQQFIGIFAHTSSTTIVMPEQEGELFGALIGPFSASDGTVDTSGGQTIISYRLSNPEINSVYSDQTVFTFIRTGP